jgi:hypothetical protein
LNLLISFDFIYLFSHVPFVLSLGSPLPTPVTQWGLSGEKWVSSMSAVLQTKLFLILSNGRNQSKVGENFCTSTCEFPNFSPSSSIFVQFWSFEADKIVFSFVVYLSTHLNDQKKVLKEIYEWFCNITIFHLVNIDKTC